MDIIRIDGCLTQTKLETTLKQIVRPENWLGKEIQEKSYRWDMAYRSNDGVTTVVEFDGDSHYRDSLCVKRDRYKDAIASNLGYKIVRIPYWVQLTSETLKFYFDLDASIEQDFKHGFITTKKFPASFCDLGLERFIREMCFLPDNIVNEVIDSLISRSNEYGVPYVIPTKLAQEIIPFPQTEPRYYDQYLKLGGKKAKDEFYYHLEVFLCLTMDSYTGRGISNRDMAFSYWCEHINSFEEASRFFEAVDSVHSYS